MTMLFVSSREEKVKTPQLIMQDEFYLWILPSDVLLWGNHLCGGLWQPGQESKTAAADLPQPRVYVVQRRSDVVMYGCSPISNVVRLCPKRIVAGLNIRAISLHFWTLRYYYTQTSEHHGDQNGWSPICGTQSPWGQCRAGGLGSGSGGDV